LIDYIVGWVEATKPNKTRYLCWAVPALRLRGPWAKSKGSGRGSRRVLLSLYPTYKFLSHYFICSILFRRCIGRGWFGYMPKIFSLFINSFSSL